MGRYLLARVVQMVPLLFVASAVVFLLLNLMPGDPIAQMVRETPNAASDPDYYLRLRQQYGLDDPLPIGYVKWLGQMLRGDPGYSVSNHAPVMEIVVPRLRNTLLLTVTALLIGQLLALLVGVYSALRQYTIGDYVATAVAFFGFSVPGFWLALMLIMLFGVQLRWLPTGGITSPFAGDLSTFEQVGDYARHMLLPLVALVVTEMAGTMRFMRSSLLEVVHQDYLVTARAKGLPEALVIRRHALRNALIPVVTIIALSLPRIVAGSVVIETVFAYPGVGKLLYDSITFNDFPVAMTVVLLITLLVVVFNIVADVLYGVLDPRVRYAS